MLTLLHKLGDDVSLGAAERPALVLLEVRLESRERIVERNQPECHAA